MTLAILTTYYNEVETIDEVVDAIAITPVPFTLYFVDDCSSKPPTNVLKRYGNEDWFHYMRNSENKGQVFGLNKAIKLAIANGAEFIAINDADDISYENRFTKQLQTFADDPDLMIVGGAADFTDQETGKLLWQTRHACDNKTIHRHNKINSTFIHSTVMYRASIFDEVGLYNEDAYANDYDMISRVLASGCKAANLPDVVLRYNIRDDSMSVSKRRTQVASRLRVQLKHIKPFDPWSLWGIMRSLIAYIAPNKAASNIKAAFYCLKNKHS